MKITFFPGFLFLTFLLATCDSGPKVVEGEPVSTGNNSSPAAQVLPGGQAAEAAEHKVVVEEALNTERYTYLQVNENGEHFWIAIPKTPVEIGATYYYQGGLLKRNFVSQEYNRVFETIYLVSGISNQPFSASGSAVDQVLSRTQSPENLESPTKIDRPSGSVKISDLTGNLSKYEGKTIRVTGKVMKVNPMIMGRNWVHLQDGTANNFDLTITTMETVELGSIVTLEGTIALNKDFGAGYKYNVIMESATVIQ